MRLLSTCFDQIISYESEMEQIEDLISVTELSDLVDRNGDKYQYWHGDRNETPLGPGLTDSSAWVFLEIS